MTVAGELRLGLIGFPLEHSFSPRLHQAALTSLGLRGDYRLYALPPLPEGEAQMRDLLSTMRRGELDGLNVTIPHKASLIPYLDDLSPSARAIGAVNTLLVRDGALLGENTDAAGFLADVQRLWGERMTNERPALVLGAGGAARAVVYALLLKGWQVVVLARRNSQAHDLCRELDPLGAAGESTRVGGALAAPAHLHLGTSAPDEARRWGEWLEALNPALVVNATPVGMFPRVDASPWPPQAPFPQGARVYDLVYNPPQTRLLREAEAAGLPAAHGLGMLVEQAARAFHLWTGLRPPVQALWEAVS